MTAYPPDFGDLEEHRPYAYEANGFTTVYLHGAEVAHIVSANMLSDGSALCGACPEDPCPEGCWNCGWYGTGDWDETMRARRLPLCQDCVDTARAAYPKTCSVERVDP